MEKLFIHSFETKIGLIRTAATRKGLAVVCLPGECRSSFEATLSRLFPHHERQTGGAINLRAESQIQGYLDGRRRSFSIKLDIHGTAFQRLALEQVATIPYGRTMSYGQIAEAIGHPKASRAVGSANAGNNLPLVIPCHRVVASNGLGGYGGGLPLKVKLLQMEGALRTNRS